MKTIVIGAGVIGLSTAWSLQRRGVEVQVLEARAVGQSASAVNAGWIVPSISTPLASPGILSTGLKHAFDPDGALTIRPKADWSWLKWLWSFQRSARQETFKSGVGALMNLNRNTLDLFDEMAADGVEFEMRQEGLLALATSDHGLGWFEQVFDVLIPLGFTGGIDYISGAEARERDGAVGHRVRKAAHTSIDRHVSPDGLLRGLHARLGQLGVKVHEHTSVSGLRRQGSGWLVQTSQGDFEAENVVVALGAETNSVLKDLKVKLPIMAAKGYSVDIVGEGEPPRHALYLMESKLGLSPLREGVRIAGAFELPGKDEEVHGRRVRQLVEQTRPYVDGWQPNNLVVDKGRAGMRPATPDSLPFLGPIPGHDGVFVAAGHGMLGVTLAPASAEALTTMIVDRVVPHELLPFQLAGRA